MYVDDLRTDLTVFQQSLGFNFQSEEYIGKEKKMVNIHILPNN